MIAFAYYGGKQSHLQHILPLLPETDHYVEPFAGSLAVLLNRIPSKIETISDLNGDLINFFKVLRDNPKPLIRSLQLTPYSRAEFTQAWEPVSDPVEQARRWYIRVSMDIAKAGAKKDRSWSVNKTYTKNEHSYCVHNFYNKITGFMAIHQRLMNVQIDCKPADEMIVKFDSKDTLFYCDPPYLPDTRKSHNDYKFEMTVEHHRSLAERLHNVKGMVALSGYDSEFMRQFYPGWHKVVFPSKKPPMSRGSGRVTQECLWTNYDPFRPKGQLTIFQVYLGSHKAQI